MEGKAQQPKASVVFSCDSSEDEIESLIVRVKQRMAFPATRSTEGQTGTSGKRPLGTASKSFCLGMDGSWEMILERCWTVKGKLSPLRLIGALDPSSRT